MDTQRRIPDFRADWLDATSHARLIAQLTPLDANDVRDAIDVAEQRGLADEHSVIIAELVDHLRSSIAVGDRMARFLEHELVREALKGLEYDEEVVAMERVLDTLIENNP